TLVMPKLERIDIQQFIATFAEAWKRAEPKARPAQPASAAVEVPPRNIEYELMALRNEYASQLLAKDAELRKRDTILNQMRLLLAEVPSNVPGYEHVVTHAGTKPNVAMWVEKLGNGGASRILKFLAEKSGMKFSRSQIALAVGLSARSGSFAGYIAH